MSRYLIKSTFACINVVLISSFWFCNAQGFEVRKTNSGAEIKWSTPNATYYINASGGPSGSLSAIQSAMQTWTNVSTSNFSFIYNGEIQSSNFGENDGTNIICFGPMGDDGTVGLNHSWFNTTTGELLDSDIKFNTNYSWDTYGSSTDYDVENVATHELGHSLSLSDLYDPTDSEKTMYGFGSLGETKQRSLHQDDIDGITYLYGGATITTISSTTTIPSSSTTTTPITTTTTMSSACPPDYPIDCGNGYCCPPDAPICGYGQDTGYCFSEGGCLLEELYGEHSDETEILRYFRDIVLSKTTEGRELIKLYYQWSPMIVKAMEADEVFKEEVKEMIDGVLPMIRGEIE